MVFKKVIGLQNTYEYIPKLAIYNAELEDIVCIDESFFKIIENGFKEVNFIFNLENSNSNGI